MKLYEYWLGLHPLDWEFCFMPVQTYKNANCNNKLDTPW